MTEVVLEERQAGASKRIGVATLNQEKTLNALSGRMVELLAPRLRAWADDPAIAIVVLQGAGDKAFCAGGDLQGLHRSIVDFRASGATDVRANTYATRFFADEYRLDYAIHHYPKPILCWGHGIVMGGGIGLMSGASHRVVTEGSRLAMPEVSVGLYPDVGGSWQLGRAPGRTGLFLALTGAQIRASDAIFAGLADVHIRQADKPAVMAALLEQAWSDAPALNRQALGRLLAGFASAADPKAGPLREHFDLIGSVCRHPTLAEIVPDILALADSHRDDPWLTRAAATLRAGSPGSARLAYELQRRTRRLSLADVFRIELVVSLHCAAHGDFGEGIRALLIDKDNRPSWRPARLAEADKAWADAFFVSPWPAAEHPLADLGR
ncbi:MAG: enoyl-CoA hydratase/isomerase family protein [Burkholderiaceae bacterium]